jgi:hypothetical protein
MATRYTNKKAALLAPGDIVVTTSGPMVVLRAQTGSTSMTVTGREARTGTQMQLLYPAYETVAVLGSA